MNVGPIHTESHDNIAQLNEKSALKKSPDVFLKELDMLKKKTPGKNIYLTYVAQWNVKNTFLLFKVSTQ